MNKGKILFLLIISAIVIGLIAVGFWYKEFIVSSRSLSDYVPESALSYVEINLSDKNLNSYIKKRSKARKYLEEFVFKNQMEPNIWRGEVAIEKIGLVILPGKKGNYEKAWLIQGRDNIRQLEATEIVDYYYASLNHKIGVLSRSRQAMRKIRNYKPDNGLSGLLNSKANNYAASGFIDGDLWNKAINNFITVGDAGGEYFNFKKNSRVTWQIKIEDGEFVFSAELPIKINKKIGRSAKGGGFYEINNSIVFNSIRLDEALMLLRRGLAVESEVDFELLEKYLNERYKTDIKELYTFFEQPVSIILKPKRLLTDSRELFQFDNYDYAIVIEGNKILPGDSVLAGLENLVQNYLAFKHPIRQEKILPDKSLGYELVAVPEKYAWREIKGSKFNLKRLKYNTREVVYGLNGDRFIFGNSVDLVNKIFETKKNEAMADKYILRFDTDIIDNDFLNLGGLLWLNSESKGDKIIIRGQLTDK